MPVPPPAARIDTCSTGFLLGLVRKLIDYGKQLAATLRQHQPATSFSPIPRYERIIGRSRIWITDRFAIALPAPPAVWTPPAGYATGPP